MNSRERLDRALHHQAADRIPIDLGSANTTGVHVRVVEQLRQAFDLAPKPVKVIEPYQMLGEVDAELREALGIDVVGIRPLKTMFGFDSQGWREFRTFWGQVVLVPSGFVTTLDSNGDLLIYPEGDRSAPPSGRMPSSGFFFDAIVRQEPIDEAQLDPRQNQEEFELLSPADLAHWRTEIAQYRASGTTGLVLNMPGTALGDVSMVPAPWLKAPHGVRDIAQWYMTTLTRPDFVQAIFDRQTEIAVKNFETLHRIVGNDPQGIFLCGTDFGTQDSQFCSPETFRDLYLPYYRRMTDWIHRNTTWKVFKHSCGAVMPLLDVFVEAGIDILNPVQINAVGMDSKLLKDRYGDHLVFWGGGVDTQRVLPFARPQEVEDHVLRQCEVFGRGGGFVFNPVHNIQANVPVENVLAAFRAARRASA